MLSGSANWPSVLPADPGHLSSSPGTVLLTRMMTLSLRRGAASALLLFMLTCAGCLAPPPITTPLPPGLAVTPVAQQLLPRGPVAVSPDGSLVALVRREGLLLRSLDGKAEQKLDADHPVALAFNPDGSELAAAFSAADGSRLRRFATSTGEVLGEISFSGHCEALLSRKGEWLAFVTILEPFRFGGNLSSRLLRWDGGHDPVETSLNDTTLDRSTLAAAEMLTATLRPQLSPHDDEILFLRLHDPPAFAPYVAVVLHHLETGSERLIAKLPLFSGSAIYLDGGELVAYGDGINLVRIIDPWSEAESQRLVRAGNQLASPASGDMLWVDEALLRRDGQELLTAAKEAEPVAFLPAGRLLLRTREELWLLSGLPVTATATSQPDSEELRLLRKWRAAGLIDAREYAERLKK